MPLFGRHRARNDAANVTPRRRGWALFSPYPQGNRYSRDALMTQLTQLGGPAALGSSAADRTVVQPKMLDVAGGAPGRADARANEAQRVPFVTKVKRTLGIQRQGQRNIYMPPPRGKRASRRAAGINATTGQLRPERGGFFGNSQRGRGRERRADAERSRGLFFSRRQPY